MDNVLTKRTHFINMMFQNTDSLIFDLDGTLWDASETSARAWDDLLNEHGITEYTIDAAAIRAVSGLSIKKIFKEHFLFIPEKMRPRLLEAYKLRESEYMKELGGTLYPDVKEVLIALTRNYKLFVVSNCISGYIENFIEFHKLQGLFKDFECSGRTGQLKSENIKSIIKRNSLKEPVYIGDTIWDCEAAQAAGIPFIYASYGFGKVGNTVRVESFKEIRNLFNK